IECDFGRLACAICFDLNFDELRLKYVKSRPDLILFCSVYHGGLMQSYWAYSCRAHFVSAVAGLPSAVISPLGQTVAETTNYTDSITAIINLDCCLAHLDYNWERLKKLKKAYGEEVLITDPGYLGSVLISSQTEKFSAVKLAEEFEIELLDDYMNRVLAHRREALC
ncbi:MAG: carbon-nitrogen hydrolase family protein, partial [bacterium]|nr:carbon-nitrogen hydrolase family protein [bacterium]